ncbi:MAG TPA: glutathione S-transferase [Pseudohongiella sp.]|nr:glutathione S-transferase [Pseudohongiella sp.]HBX37556.1 glutathione S-transferase [Pseudohongiella sp.]|tara:strand:+ start:2133 stop:3269 length:1137 start_codon:yes stop_codon:yes gene_type:complete
MTDHDNSTYILYGVPHSLYTGIARCYLRTQNIPYLELPPTHPDFASMVVPAIQRSIIPVLVTPSKEIIQDSLDIIDHFEQQGVRYSAYPEPVLLKVLAIIVQYYGCQAMRRHAMHYRWSFPEEQHDFLRAAFSAGSGPDYADKVMSRMQSYLPMLGVTATTIPLIEQSYHDLLEILERHLSNHPYLFGGYPCIADYGLIGPMFAHLGRDPVPSSIMKRKAPHVFRWVERMTAPGLDVPDFPDYGDQLIDSDSIPETLVALLNFIRSEIFPELTDKLAALQAHADNQQPAHGAPVADKAHKRSVGQIDTTFRGASVTVGVEPYLLYLLDRAADCLDSVDASTQHQLMGQLRKFGLEKAIPAGGRFTVGRQNNIEVWLKK